MQNRDLLDVAELEGFDGFVTTDQNLKYQQNLSNRRIAIVFLTTSSWAIVEKGVKPVTDAIDGMKPGDEVEIVF